MSDYIKREDAIRQIVKTSAQNELDIHAIGTVIYILSEMDSADVVERSSYESMEHTVAKLNEALSNSVEVIRCKDCKHFDTGYCGIPFIGKKVNPNHYCSYGERKDEGL